MSFSRYPKYKPSGVEWLGEVPEHWDVCALNYRFEVALGKMLDEKRISGDHLAPYLRNTDVQWGRVNIDDLPQMDFEGDDLIRYSLKSGDLLVCEGGEVGRAAIWNAPIEECYYQKALHRIRARGPKSDAAKFLYYCFATVAALGVFSGSGGKSTIAHLTAEALRRYRFGFPPLPEQIRIAGFLDQETAKIDGLVTEQRRLMELLKEKRQTVISHAVTRGLNPDAPFKPSGIEWLGHVPEHWDVRRIATVFREIMEPGNDELPILSVSIHHGVSDKEIDDDDMDRKVARSEDRSKYKRVAPGDLVYNMMRAWQGGFGTVTVEGMVSPAYVVARPQLPLVTAYIEHLLRTPPAIEQMRRHSRGVTDFRLRLYWDEFKNIRVPLPPEDEAVAICAKIAEMQNEFGALTAACEASIALLEEHRTALISAAVSGQIDVRGFVEAEAA